MTSSTPTPTRTFTARALDAELGRRVKNVARVKAAIAAGATKEEAKKAKKKTRSFVLPSLSAEDVATIKNGGVVTVEFNSGRVEHVGLKV